MTFDNGATLFPGWDRRSEGFDRSEVSIEILLRLWFAYAELTEQVDRERIPLLTQSLKNGQRTLRRASCDKHARHLLYTLLHHEGSDVGEQGILAEADKPPKGWMHLVGGWDEVLAHVFGDRFVRLKGWKDIDESKQVYLEIGSAHRPLHEDTVEVTGVEKGWVGVSEISEDLSTEVDNSRVKSGVESHPEYQ